MLSAAKPAPPLGREHRFDVVKHVDLRELDLGKGGLVP